MGRTWGQAGSGLKPNVAGLLCYAFFWLGGLVMLPVEKDKFIRFHAIQSLVAFGSISGAFLILFWIPKVGWVFSYLLGALALVIWVVMMIKAYRGNRFKLPWAGDFAEKRA